MGGYRPRGENYFEIICTTKYKSFFRLQYETSTVVDGSERRSADYSIKSKEKLINAIKKVEDAY